MKNNQTKSSAALCPFYNKESAAHKVYCEGYYEGMSVTHNFEDVDLYEYFRGHYCYSDWTECPHASKLLKEYDNYE